MDQTEAATYALALATLNAVVGLRFAELQAAMTDGNRNGVDIHRLKERFETVYSQRDSLGNASADTLRQVIAEHAPEVRAHVKGADDGNDAKSK
mgnify:CR=1 FL=1